MSKAINDAIVEKERANHPDEHMVALTHSELFALRVAMEYYKEHSWLYYEFQAKEGMESSKHSRSCDTVADKLDEEWMK